MQSRPERVLISGYALSRVLVCRELINLLKPKLTTAERNYIEVDGPEIVHQRFLHSIYTEPGSCGEGRAAAKEASRLKGEAKRKLDEAGVSPERQLLLQELLFAADVSFHNHFPLMEVKHIEFNMLDEYKSGSTARLRELAQLIDAPREIQEFVDLLHKEAAALAASRELQAAA